MGSVSDWEGSGRDCKSKDCTDVPAPAVDNLAAQEHDSCVRLCLKEVF